MKHQIKAGIVLGLLLGLASGCGKPPSKPFKGLAQLGTAGDHDVGDSTGQSVDAEANIPIGASLTAFEANVYTPILGPFCSGCHSETFAPKMEAPLADGTPGPMPAGIDKAHTEFLKRTNFNAFAGIDQTLPVTKMDYKVGGHNCWLDDPKKCYDGMTAAITAWLKDLETAGFKPTVISYPNATEAVPFAAALPITVPFNPNEYAVGRVETATVAAPFIKGTDDVDGPTGTYAMAPMGTAPGGNAANQAQVLTFNLDVKAAGTYYTWMRVKTPAAANSRFFYGANGAAAIQFLPGATSDWKWIRVFNIANNANTEVPQPVTINAAATVPVRVFYRDPLAKVNMVVLTTRKDDFNGDLFSQKFMDVKVPLKVPGVEGAFIVATVWEAALGDGKKSLGVKELKIESPVPLRVKNIKPLINGLYFRNHATYTIVDTVAGGANPVIQTGGAGTSTGSIWIADRAIDKISFSFETIEVAP